MGGPFQRLLVANRGEIACRVIRAAQDLGLQTVAVFSDADQHARHVGMADQAVRIGPAALADSYLSIPALLDAAARSGAQAVHPGYGFLSENAAFAQAVLDAGLVWVGPPPAAIAAMGDKARAKDAMRKAGVPVVPGAEGSVDALREAAEGIGLPLLVKAAAGGGGRGMRRVDRVEDLDTALRSAASEAASAFGDGSLLLERLVVGARHVELQILADQHGTVLHLGERDCSVQRRHQKVLEEAPSPAVDADLRATMGAAAVAAAKAVDYVGAGTVEFLLDDQGRFYFLEMNTRLQVEHPVTERVWGVDLVQWQLHVAMGRPLPWSQDQLQPSGHAIEARLYAEDPHQGYLPQTGRVLAFVPPASLGDHFHHGLVPGLAVTADYDPMLGKLVAWGPDRAAALAALDRALDQLVLLGVGTNRRWLRQVLAQPAFRDGAATTAWLEQAQLPAPSLSSQTLAIAAALWVDAVAGPMPADGPLRNAHPFDQPVDLVVADQRQTLWVGWSNGLHVRVGQERHQVALHPGSGPVRRVAVDGVERTVHAVVAEGRLYLEHDQQALVADAWRHPGQADDAGGSGSVTAPTSGRVIDVQVAVGDVVQPGDTLLLLEAMKLETPVRSTIAGTVVEVRAQAGRTVQQGQLLVRVEQPEAPESP